MYDAGTEAFHVYKEPGIYIVKASCIVRGICQVCEKVKVFLAQFNTFKLNKTNKGVAHGFTQ